MKTDTLLQSNRSHIVLSAAILRYCCRALLQFWPFDMLRIHSTCKQQWFLTSKPRLFFSPPSSLSCLLIQLHAAATASIYTFFKQNTAAGAYHSRIIYATQLQLRPLLEISDGEVRRPDKPQPPAPASVMNMHVNKCRERRRVPLTRPPPARSAHVYHVTESRKTPLSRRLYSSNVSWRVCSTSCNTLCQRHSCSFSWNACRSECLIFHPTL